MSASKAESIITTARKSKSRSKAMPFGFILQMQANQANGITCGVEEALVALLLWIMVCASPFAMGRLAAWTLRPQTNV